MRALFHLSTTVVVLAACFAFGPTMPMLVGALWFASPMMVTALFAELTVYFKGGAWKGLTCTWKGSALGAFLGAAWLPVYFLIFWIWDISAVRTGSSTSALSIFLAPLWAYPSALLGGCIGAILGYVLNRRKGRVRANES